MARKKKILDSQPDFGPVATPYGLDFHLEFPTVAAFVERAAIEFKCDLGRYSRKRETGWHGGSFAEACQFATEGWSEGIARVREISARVSHQLAYIEGPSTYFDVAGSYPDVARYCDGEPESMVEFTELECKRPFARITVNGVLTAGTSIESRMRHGAEIAALVDALEARRIRTEIVIHTSMSAHGDGCGVVTVHLKHAHEVLDMGRIVYALAHPTFTRRLTFAVMETLPMPLRQKYGIGAHSDHFYGTLDVTPEPLRGEIHFEATPPRSTPEESARSIEDHIRKLEESSND